MADTEELKTLAAKIYWHLEHGEETQAVRLLINLRHQATCKSRGWDTCSLCRGKKVITEPRYGGSPDINTCPQCHGEGMPVCPHCNASPIPSDNDPRLFVRDWQYRSEHQLADCYAIVCAACGANLLMFAYDTGEVGYKLK